ncbi:MATE family efflux transporter [Rhizobium sp. Root482]|jgi:MATE family multidrug resistance protein|uniref:MATE family efflux transporter n=1 Tax=Rhizobium sp. Root482 TaxID=1736543 RepID=UPI0006F2CD61|nr:MATE family efflux transporter [Rhizobium sp. Root482]KQY13124.1 MATE family efflux transporter [Rhizobium sp. Root482]
MNILPPVEHQENWNRRMVTLAFPIILANLAQPILSLVDTMVAGHLPGAWFLGGVALGGVLFNFLFWSFSFLRMATTGLVAQAWGAEDGALMRKHLLRALLIAAAGGGAIILLQKPIIEAGLAFLGGSEAVYESAAAYAFARIWSAPATLGNFVLLGYLLGRQRVMVSLALQVMLNAINLIATLVLVFGFDWGVAGIGAGTAIAEWIAFIAGLMIVRPFRANPALELRDLLDGTAFRQLIAVNRDIFLRSLFLLVCFAWFARSGAAEGDAILAANAVLLNLHGITSYGLDGFAHATETLVGSAIGARRRQALYRVIKAAFVWSGLVALLFSLCYALAGPSIIALLTNQEEVRATAVEYLPYVVVLPLISVVGYMLDGVFIGAIRTRDLRNSMFISTIVFIVAAYGLQQVWGNHGLWIGMIVLMIVRTATLGRRLKYIFAGL